MTEQMMSAIIGGISGSICGSISSGLIYWLLDKRREMKKDNKHSQARKDLMGLLKIFPEIQEEYKTQNSTQLIKFYFDNIGLSRRNKISTALEMMELFKINKTYEGYSLSIRDGYHKCTKDDFRVLIKNVENGNYDNCFEVI